MDKNFIFLIAQIIGIIAFIFSLVAYHKKYKNKILFLMICSNVLNLIHYFLLNAYSGCITKVVAICRDFLIVNKKKNNFLSSNVFLLIFIIIYILIGILTYKNIFSLLPIIAAMIYFVVVWYGNELSIKRGAFYTYFLWLVYNIFVFSVSGIISNIISIVSTFIAIKNEKKYNKI